MSKKNKKTYFQDEWVSDPKYRGIFKKTENPRTAFCVVCSREFSLSNMGKSALASHQKGAKHMEKINAQSTNYGIQHFAAPVVAGAGAPRGERDGAVDEPSVQHADANGPSAKPAADECQANILSGVPVRAAARTSSVQVPDRTLPSTSGTIVAGGGGDAAPTTMAATTPGPAGIFRYVVADEVTAAEIRWAMFSVQHHLSMRSGGAATVIFPLMFPDSKIASKISIERTKLSYTVTFGLAEYFQESLLKEVKGSQCFVAMFDESLNKISQKQQMDIALRFWSPVSDDVTCKYFSSAFLTKCTARDLLVNFRAQVEPLAPKKKLLSLSIDGPNVNLKFVKDLLQELKSEVTDDDPLFLFMGTCGLHTLNNSFKCGAKNGAKWKVVQFLRALYNFFKDVPARRGYYTSVTGSDIMPLKFCAVRWLLSGRCADRAISMMPHLEEFKAHLEKDPGGQAPPDTYSYRVISNSLEDKFLTCKLSFFSYVSSLVEPFLTKYQTDDPLVPFLYTDLLLVISDLFSLFVKKRVLSETSCPIKVDLKDKNNLIDPKQFELSFGVKAELKKVKCDKQCIVQFKSECVEFLKAMCIKLQLKSPLRNDLCQAVTFCDPSLLVYKTETALKRMKSTLEIFQSSNWLTANACDRILKEMKAIVSKESSKTLLKEYKRPGRVDHFWKKFLLENTASDELKDFIKKVLTLSHGNAFSERGFSINKEILVENLQEKSLIAQRLVCDGLNRAGGVNSIVIDKKMISLCRHARRRYQECLEEKRKANREEAEAKQNRKRILDTVSELMDKRAKLLVTGLQEVESIDQKIQDLKRQLKM